MQPLLTAYCLLLLVLTAYYTIYTIYIHTYIDSIVCIVMNNWINCNVMDRKIPNRPFHSYNIDIEHRHNIYFIYMVSIQTAYHILFNWLFYVFWWLYNSMYFLLLYWKIMQKSNITGTSNQKKKKKKIEKTKNSIGFCIVLLVYFTAQWIRSNTYTYSVWIGFSICVCGTSMVCAVFYIFSIKKIKWKMAGKSVKRYHRLREICIW